MLGSIAPHKGLPIRLVFLKTGKIILMYGRFRPVAGR